MNWFIILIIYILITCECEKELDRPEEEEAFEADAALLGFVGVSRDVEKIVGVVKGPERSPVDAWRIGQTRTE